MAHKKNVDVNPLSLKSAKFARRRTGQTSQIPPKLRDKVLLCCEANKGVVEKTHKNNTLHFLVSNNNNIHTYIYIYIYIHTDIYIYNTNVYIYI